MDVFFLHGYIKKIKDQVIYNSGIDAIISSTIIDSTTNAHFQEQGRKGDFRLSEDKTKLSLTWDYEADVVVAGYGGSGAAAAIEAHDAGSVVVILEKETLAGGTTAMSGGIIVGAGTSIQKAHHITDSPEEMYKYFRATGRGLEDPDLMNVL